MRDKIKQTIKEYLKKNLPEYNMDFDGLDKSEEDEVVGPFVTVDLEGLHSVQPDVSDSTWADLGNDPLGDLGKWAESIRRSNQWFGFEDSTPHGIKTEPYTGGLGIDHCEVKLNYRSGIFTQFHINKCIEEVLRQAKQKDFKYVEHWIDMASGDYIFRFFWKEPSRAQQFTGRLKTL